MKKIFTLALALAATVAASADVWVIGALNPQGSEPDPTNTGWPLENSVKLVETAAGSNIWSGEVVLNTGWFGICTVDPTGGDWDSETGINANRWEPYDGKSSISLNEDKDIAPRDGSGDDAFNLEAAAGTGAVVTITVDMNENYLVVTSEEDLQVDNSLYVRGGGTDANWAALPEYKFTEEPAGTWTLEGEMTITGAFKISNPSWSSDVNFGSDPATPAAFDNGIKIGVPYNLYIGADAKDLFIEAETGSTPVAVTKMTIVITTPGAGGVATLLVEAGDAAINDIVVDSNEAVEYYNLQGVKVSANELPAGLYIAKQGAKTSKVLVK